MKEFMHIGETKDTDIPELLKSVIEEQLEILDNEYGISRDKYASDGGYSVIVESGEDFATLENRHNLNIVKPFNEEEDHFSISEWTEQLVTREGKKYSSILFLLSNDYGVCVYVDESLLPENSPFLEYDSVREEE
jgi:hypothetical protein